MWGVFMNIDDIIKWMYIILFATAITIIASYGIDYFHIIKPTPQPQQDIRWIEYKKTIANIQQQGQASWIKDKPMIIYNYSSRTNYIDQLNLSYCHYLSGDGTTWITIGNCSTTLNMKRH
jgi:hypothetical protein